MTFRCSEELILLATREKLCCCYFLVVVVIEGNANLFHSWESCHI